MKTITIIANGGARAAGNSRGAGRSSCLRVLRLSFLVALTLLLAGCNSRSGWGVVLWSIPDTDITSGSVVRILTESHINNVYIIQGGKANKRLEVPFWQLRKFRFRFQTGSFVKSFAPWAHLYARAERDGLPIRDAPDNNAKRVFKLRDKQTVKVLGKAAGEKVSSGDEELQGEWYQVLCDDGTVGYCFSYALTIYDEAKGKDIVVAASGTSAASDAELERFFSTDWRPDYFRDMTESGHIDLESFGPDYGFLVDRSAKTVTIKLPQSNVSFSWQDVSRLKEGVYRFEGAQLIVTLKQDGTLAAQYAERGVQKSAVFIPFTGDVQQILDAEKARRAAAFADLVKKGSVLKSSSFGTLTLAPDGRFGWTGFGALMPTVIPADAGENGRVELRYFLDPSLAPQFDGVISFAFLGMKPDSWVDFLYKRSDQGIQLEYFPEKGLDGNVAVRRSSSPVVIFFAY